MCPERQAREHDGAAHAGALASAQQQGEAFRKALRQELLNLEVRAHAAASRARTPTLCHMPAPETSPSLLPPTRPRPPLLMQRTPFSAKKPPLQKHPPTLMALSR